MAALSGKNGTVTFNSVAFSEMTGWSLNWSVNDGAYASSNTGGYKTRVFGVQDWTATVNVKYVSGGAHPVAHAGAIANLALTVDGTDTYSGNAMLVSDSVETDLDTGNPVGIVLNFAGCGALTVAT